MNVKIVFSKKSEKFLKKSNDLISESDVEELLIKAIKNILKIENSNIDLKKMKGEYKNYFRIRKGDIRIIFSIIYEPLTIIVNDINFRKDIYK